MKIFQIVNGVCKWETPFSELGEALDKYPEDLVFVEAPDYVFEGWLYIEVNEETGEPVTGEDRFILPELPEGMYYDPDTGAFYDDAEVEEFANKAKEKKQSENKQALNAFLHENPLLWKDGKYYGVTIEDQYEIQLNIQSYNVMVEQGVEHPVVYWHSVHAEAVEWDIADLQALLVDITNYIAPYFTKMNEYKSAIYRCTTKDEVLAIEISYSK